MSAKISLSGSSLAFAVSVAGIFAVAATLAPTAGFSQTAPAEASTSIKHTSPEAKKLKEPSFQTREERLKAKPLDWHATVGKPKPRTLTEQEKKLQKSAKPESSAVGKPDPKAEQEARRLHPDDWKK
jgi:hypothetical protein